MLFPKEMIQIVVNQFQNGHPVTADIIGRQIGKPVFGVVAKDDQTCIRALSTSTPVFAIAQNSPFSQGVLEIVRKLKQKNVLASLEKLKKPESPAKKEASMAVSSKTGKSPWTELKIRIHKALVEEMDMKKQDDNDPKAVIILREKTKKLTNNPWHRPFGGDEGYAHVHRGAK
jgi:septum site-determining protein MinD